MSLSEAQNAIATMFIMLEMNDVKHFLSDSDVRYVTGELRHKKYCFSQKIDSDPTIYTLTVDDDIRIISRDPKAIVNGIKLLMKNKYAIIPKSICQT